jgi:glycosyltransferase involved in cell wall biosynthesis
VASEASATGTFIVHGDVVPEYGAVLAPMLAHPSVEVRGFTADPAGALAAADVLVLPTIEEGSALVTYEAQAVGCVPLVSSAAGALAQDGVHAFIHEPRDVMALSGHFSRLASDRALLARLSAEGIAHRPDLGWDAAARVLVTGYRSVLDRNPQ